MPDALEAAEKGLRIVHGVPEVVEEWIERNKESYVVTNIYYYVVENRLMAAVTAIHQREVRKQQLANSQLLHNSRMRPN